MAEDFAAEAAAATAEFIAKTRAAQEKKQADAQGTSFAAADAARVSEFLAGGGRVLCSVRSRATGDHVTVLLACKKKGANGRYISRQRIAGRVGIGEADAVFCDDPDADQWLGTYSPRYGRWCEGHGDPARTWAARAVLRWVTERDFHLEQQAEVFLATECSYCGKRLTDPVSVERGIGPECFKRTTGSKAAPRQQRTLA